MCRDSTNFGEVLNFKAWCAHLFREAFFKVSFLKWKLVRIIPSFDFDWSTYFTLRLSRALWLSSSRRTTRRARQRRQRRTSTGRMCSIARRPNRRPILCNQNSAALSVGTRPAMCNLLLRSAGNAFIEGYHGISSYRSNNQVIQSLNCS